ncbi:hypothetical protein NFI96_015843 [Prochilodus magdalenae]|nr:hypothetical protein NFI96_015843 [Prochilodus magdalenae]
MNLFTQRLCTSFGSSSSTIIMVTTLILMLATCAGESDRPVTESIKLTTICQLIHLCCPLSPPGTLSEPSRIYMSVTVGSSATLPCDWRNESSSRPPHIEWRSIHQTIFERQGKELFQGEGYERRVDVPEDKLLSGDCSLVLRNIRTSDAGLYESYLLQKSRHSKRVSLQSVELSVEGKDIALPSHQPLLRPESEQEVRAALIDTSSQAGVIHPPLLILKFILLSHMLFYIV